MITPTPFTNDIYYYETIGKLLIFYKINMDFKIKTRQWIKKLNS
jgi:hypothetical protein